MSASTPPPARSFGQVADAYDRGRPSYPVAAAEWLVGREAAVVLELGAGTGKLTEVLAGLGHDVHATDPDEAMLELLRARLPQVRTSVASAERLPVPDQTYDVVIAAQAFHWFDPAVALPEIARVLAPGGHLALVWNERDERIPWARRLGGLLGTQEQLRQPHESIAASGLFGPVQEHQVAHWQEINRRSILDLAASRSNIALLDDDARAAKLAEVLALYDDYGRGMDGMRLPYVAHCYRASVLASAHRLVEPPRDPAPRDAAGDGEWVGEPTQPIRRGDDPGDDLLLIDFR